MNGDSPFAAALASAGFGEGLGVGDLEILQINVGKLCNMRCRHCHVDAGPHQVTENMSRETMEACLEVLDRTEAHTVDITGGAPELNPYFEWLVDACVARGKHVIDRCNLTVLLLPQHAHLPEWFGERGVEVVASLPHHRKPNTDAQRGEGTYERSILALKRLNAAGYGRGDPSRRLTLMHNPAGAFLSTGQASMEREWKAALGRNAGVQFDRLITLTNMPISRFLDWLVTTDNLDSYMAQLTAAFNPAAVAGLMCRNTLSIGWDGAIYDCDFNQMLAMPTAGGPTVWTFDPAALRSRKVKVDRHCFGCTAGAGSSCGGATVG